MRSVLRDPALDPAFKALVLTPARRGLCRRAARTGRPAAHPRRARGDAARSWPSALHADWVWAWEAHQVREGYRPMPAQAGRRALANLALAMLVRHAVRQRRRGLARPRLPARQGRRQHDRPLRRAAGAGRRARSRWPTPALAHFHALFRGDALVLDKWFALQARAPEAADGARLPALRPGTRAAEAPGLLAEEPEPRAQPAAARCAAATRPPSTAPTPRATCSGPSSCSSSDAINPQIAARLARAMDRWSALAEPYRSAAREAIARVAGQGRPERRRARDRHAAPWRNPACMTQRISLTQYLVEQQREHGRIPAPAAPADRGRRARLQAHRHRRSTRARWATCWAAPTARTCRARCRRSSTSSATRC